jgi:hypothetical protein
LKKKTIFAHIFGIDVSIDLQLKKRTSPAFIISSCLEDKACEYLELFECHPF